MTPNWSSPSPADFARLLVQYRRLMANYVYIPFLPSKEDAPPEEKNGEAGSLDLGLRAVSQLGRHMGISQNRGTPSSDGAVAFPSQAVA